MAHTLLGYVSRTHRWRPRRWHGPALILLLLIFGICLPVSAQPDPIYRLPAGTRIKLKLDAEINSRVAAVNDTFLAFVASPVSIREVVVLPVGTTIEGRIRRVQRAGVAGRSGQMDLVFETLKLTAGSRQIDGAMVSKARAHTSKTGKLWGIFGGAAAGAVIGGLTRSGNGALIGTAAGAGIGSGIALLKNGKDVRIGPDEIFEIELRSPVMLPVSDF